MTVSRWLSVCVLAGGCAAQTSLPLTRVVLYENGLGYFERVGRPQGDQLRLRVRDRDVDDVLKSLTVLGRGEQTSLSSIGSLVRRGRHEHELTLGLPSGADTLRVSYALSTPVWRATYRVVLDEHGTSSLLQGWAIVANDSAEDWRAVHLTLATGAPLSFAVDLHTPRHVQRPDITEHLTQGVALGAVGSTSATEADRDGDGIPDSADKCPDQPETQNGYDDDDGCPDKGRVIVTSSRLEVLDTIYFAKGSATIKQEAEPLVDAIAETMRGNPQISLIEIGGFADESEGDALGISALRARAIIESLVGKGVARTRLQAHAYGATHPSKEGHDEKSRAANRRVGFMILKRADDGSSSEEAPATVSTESIEHSVRAAAARVESAGASRYEITAPVSIPHGSSGMIAIVNQRIVGETVYLFRPDANVADSQQHPFRAARLVGLADATLESGPIAVYAGGSFVGDGILERLHAGETAFLPFALDGATTIEQKEEDEQVPVRIATIVRGVATIEDEAQHRTTYSVRAGHDAPTRIFIEHLTRGGSYTVKTMPPGAQPSAKGFLFPITLHAGQTASFTIIEHQAQKREVKLLSPGNTDLTVYAARSSLPPELKAPFDALIAERNALGELESKRETLRSRVEDAAERQGELRESLLAIAKNPRAESLRRELTQRLTEAVRQSEDLSQQRARVSADASERRVLLEQRILTLQMLP